MSGTLSLLKVPPGSVWRERPRGRGKLRGSVGYGLPRQCVRTGMILKDPAREELRTQWASLTSVDDNDSFSPS